MFILLVLRLVKRSGWFIAALLLVPFLAAAVPPPPPHPPQTWETRLADLKSRLGQMHPANITAQCATQFSRFYLEKATVAFRSKRAFAADRYLDAADSIFHVAEHQEHLRSKGGPPGPPPAADIADHLQRVYFRVKQSEYFLRQARDSHVSPFPKWAFDFYNLAQRGYGRGDMLAADENAKCAEEVVKALEDLAQAAAETPISPPPGPSLAQPVPPVPPPPPL